MKSAKHTSRLWKVQTATVVQPILILAGGSSAHKMKSHFCDDCIREILTTVEDEFIDEAVIYDAEEKTFYPVTEGDLQIGDYSFHTYYEDGGYEIKIAYTGE